MVRGPGPKTNPDKSENPDKKTETRNKFRRPNTCAPTEAIARKGENCLVEFGTKAAQQASAK
jgi:hypothetical protein